MTVSEAIRKAEAILPGHAAPEGEEDARWQAIIAVGEFVQTDPEEVCAFSEKWGQHADADLRMAIATCLLEHLLEYHFESVFERVAKCARTNKNFADTLSSCWKFGKVLEPRNAARFDKLVNETHRA